MPRGETHLGEALSVGQLGAVGPPNSHPEGRDEASQGPAHLHEAQIEGSCDVLRGMAAAHQAEKR